MTTMHSKATHGPLRLLDEPVRGPIVVGVDEHSGAGLTFTTALEIAMRGGNELIVVSAYQPLQPGELRVARREVPRDVAWRLGPDAAIQTLHEDLSEQAASAGMTIECIARQGAPAKVIVEVATANEAGLIIVGDAEPHGRGRLCRTTPDEVSRHAPCPVLIVDTAHALAA